MSSPRVIANWKENGSKKFIHQWIADYFSTVDQDLFFSSVAPPALYLDQIAKELSNRPLSVGSQNVDLFESAARTGEISPSMVHDCGGNFSLIGHSERRNIFHESDADIAEKIKLTIKANLLPVLCIGESKDQNHKNLTHAVLADQIDNAVGNLALQCSLIIAYEPVWAIGTGRTPTPNEINSIHQVIKNDVQSRFPNILLEAVLYGGSVNKGNAASFFEQKNIDGALIGGASLDGKVFAEIVNSFHNLKGI